MKQLKPLKPELRHSKMARVIRLYYLVVDNVGSDKQIPETWQEFYQLMKPYIHPKWEITEKDIEEFFNGTPLQAFQRIFDS